MPAQYDQHGVRFQFPENWELQDDTSTEWPKQVSVHDASGAFWSVTIFENAEPPVAVLQQAVDAMREEYEDLESHALEMQLSDRELYGFELQFYCLDFLVQTRMVAGVLDGRTFLLTWQAEDRDFELREPVFRAISSSMLQTAVGIPQADTQAD